MILTCPSCTMRYLVADGAVGPEGRKVRCAHCGHEWWQEGEEGLDETLYGSAQDNAGYDREEPDLEEEIHEQVFVDVPEEEPAEDDFNSILKKEAEAVEIPEGVKPVYDDPVLPTTSKTGKTSSQRLGGFAVAAVFYIGLLVAFLLMHEPISRVWPATNLIYNLVGLKPVPPGDGLTLSELQAKITDNKLVMTGDVINLKDESVKVPAILVSIVGEDEKILDRVLIAPPTDELEAQGRTTFDVVYPSIPEGAVDVNFAFSFMKAEKPESEEEKKEDSSTNEAPTKEHAPAEHSEH